MGREYQEHLWPSFFGFQEDADLLKKTGHIRHAVVITDFDSGVVRSVHLSVKKESDTKFVFSANYLYHANSRINHSEEFFRIEFDKVDSKLVMTSAKTMGVEQDVNNPNVCHNLSRATSALYDGVARKHEWINPVSVFEDNAVAIPAIGRSALPGLYANGDMKATQKITHDDDETHEPVYPALFFPAIVGFGPESYGRERSVTHNLAIPDGDGGGLYILSQKYSHGKTPLHVTMSAELTHHGKDGDKTMQLYEVETSPHKGSLKTGKIKSLGIFLPNRTDKTQSLEPVDLGDPLAVSATLKNIRMINRLIRGGSEKLREELQKKPQDRRIFLPSDIQFLSHLNQVMSDIPPAPKKSGRFVFSVIGGNATKRIVSDYDLNIGANGYKLDYYPPGEKKASSLIIDAGVLFHDQFDIAFFNAGKYLYHKYDKSHVPESKVQAFLFTHRHKDHLAQLAYLVKKGYILPPLIMPPLALNQLQREMRELEIEKKIEKAILAKCHVVDSFTDVDPRNPTKVTKTKIAGEVIEQWTEVVPGERLGQSEYFPMLKIGDFTVRVGPMPHSDPGNMYDIITPAGSHRHTGDYKLDDTIQVRQGSFKSWLTAHKPDSLSADSTGATRGADETTPNEAVIQESVTRLFLENPNSRFICPILGSNTARFTTLIAAAGAADRKYVIVDGKALEDLMRDLDKTLSLRKWALDNFDVKVLSQSSAEAKRVLAEQPDSKIVMAITGTQDEPYSSLNRALRDWLPPHRFGLKTTDIIVPLQGPIPVGDNLFRREGAAYYTEKLHGARMILPEKVAEEAKLILAGSGHASPRDIKNMIKLSGTPFVIPVHGGPKQLKAHAELAREVGAETLVLNPFEEVEIKKGKQVTVFRYVAGEFVGIRSRLPTKEQFYLKRNFQSNVFPMKPMDPTEAGVMLDSFEKSLRAHLAPNKTDTVLSEYTSFSLIHAFNKLSVNGFLIRRLPFGIEKYDKDVYEAKRISVIAGMDTETTGKDARYDYVQQYAMTITNLENKILDKIELRSAVPAYHTADPEALLVTRTSPEEIKKGSTPMVFAADISQSIKTLKAAAKTEYQKTHPDDPDPSQRVKALLVAHNLKFDDRFIRMTLGQGLYDKVRPHTTDGVIGMDTRNVARALYSVMSDKFKVTRKEGSAFLDFTLQGLCEANGIPYDPRKAHNSASYDVGRALALFQKQREIAPKIVEQMILNADTSTGHLLNDMSGMDMGFGGPHPVFSYVSPLAIRPDLKIGSFLGTTSGGRYAVVMNLAYPPKDILLKSDDEIAAILRDSNDERLELIDLRGQPIVLPAKHFFATPQGKKMPRETIDRRANYIAHSLNYVEPASGWRNLAERLDEIWNSQSAGIIASRLFDPERPELDHGLEFRSLPDGRRPQEDIIANLKLRAHATFDPINQQALRDLKNYRRAVVDYLRLESLDERAVMKPALLELYKTVAAKYKDNLLLHNVHYDIAPEDMAEKDRKLVERYRAWHGHQMATRAEESLDYIHESPALHDKYTSGKKMKLLMKDVRTYVSDQRAAFPISEDARLHIHPWREELGRSPRGPESRPSGG